MRNGIRVTGPMGMTRKHTRPINDRQIFKCQITIAYIVLVDRLSQVTNIIFFTLSTRNFTGLGVQLRLLTVSIRIYFILKRRQGAIRRRFRFKPTPRLKSTGSRPANYGNRSELRLKILFLHEFLNYLQKSMIRRRRQRISAC